MKRLYFVTYDQTSEAAVHTTWTFSWIFKIELLLVKLLVQPLLGMDIPNSFRNLPEKYFP